jgi:hypothetical protein
MIFKTIYQLNPGFLINSTGSLVTANNEVISGKKSIKGSYAGKDTYTAYLQSDSTALHLNPNTTYQVTFNYKILTTPSAGFEVLFFSPTGASKGNFLNSTLINGVSGDTGSVTLTSSLANFTDYQARWNIVGTGAIAIDDIKIVNLATGTLVVLENAEEGTEINDPRLKPGLINDVVLGPEITLDFSQYAKDGIHTTYYLRSGVIADLNDDGKNEYVFSVSPYPQISIPLTVIGDDKGALNLTSKYFPMGTPAVKHSAFIFYEDINSDGKKDIIASEAGLDVPPWTGSKIGVALANTSGTFNDVSNLIPDTTLRNYSMAIGDFNADGKKDMLMSNQDTNGVGSPSLRDYVDGKFQDLPNTISSSLWQSNGLDRTQSLFTTDFNSDGYDDLLLSGMWHGRTNTIVYGSAKGLDISTLKELAPSPLGQDGWDYRNEGWPLKRTIYSTESNSIAFDFNKDGRPDVFTTSQQWVVYLPGVITDKSILNYDTLYKDGGTYYGYNIYTTSTNIDGHNFVATTPTNSYLGYKFHHTVLPYDINDDGNMDVIGYYFTIGYGSNAGQLWGTTFFINDGLGNFKTVEGADVFPQISSIPYANQKDYRADVGAIIPVSNTASGFVGLQLLSEPNQAGKYTVQKFTSEQLTAKNLSPSPINMTAVQVTDRTNKTSITTPSGNDTIFDKNSAMSSVPNTLTIGISSDHKVILTNPNVQVLVNGLTAINATPITAVFGVNTQELKIDLTAFGTIKSLELKISGTTFVDYSNYTNVQISSINYKGKTLSLNDASYSSGGSSGSSAYSNSGTIIFSDTPFKSVDTALTIANTTIIDGGRGVDTSVYSGNSKEYQVVPNSSGTWSVIQAGSIADLLTNVERLKFTDKSIALDTNGNAGTTAKILGAVFGKESLSNKNYVGIGLYFLDSGWTYDNLAELALDAAGAKTNDQIVSLLWTNVIGTKPTAADKAPFISLLENGMTAGALAHLAADSSFNVTNINLVGLAQGGIAFIPMS